MQCLITQPDCHTTPAGKDVSIPDAPIVVDIDLEPRAREPCYNFQWLSSGQVFGEVSCSQTPFRRKVNQKPINNENVRALRKLQSCSPQNLQFAKVQICTFAKLRKCKFALSQTCESVNLHFRVAQVCARGTVQVSFVWFSPLVINRNNY
jgi:hypothetical protein